MEHQTPAAGRRATDQQQDTDIALILKEIQKINDTLKPIAETYTTVSKLGKWAMAGLVLISVVIGILLGIRNLITHAK